MKKNGITIGLTVLVAGFVFAEEEVSLFPVWHDWRYQPVAVKTAESGGDCRYYADLSEPVHGPWITNPTSSGMTVTWTTRSSCGAALDYREKGATEFTRRWITRQGAIDYNSKTHSIHLKGLKAGTEYEYRTVAAMASQDFYSTEPFASADIHTFRTANPKDPSSKVFVTADIHGSCRLMLDTMLTRSHATDAQAYFLLGDNVEDGAYNDCEYWMTFCYLDDCSRVFAKERPLVAIRGNHDCSGRDAVRWDEFMPRPDGKAYYTVRLGPVLYILIDCFNEPRPKGAQKENFSQYTAEMADWLRSLKATEEWKTATYRVAMCHFGVVSDFCVGWPREAFGDILKDDSPEGRIHLFLCGHDHAHKRKNPGAIAESFPVLRQHGAEPKPAKEKPPRIDRKTGKAIPPPLYTNDYPFAEIELDICEGMTIEADAKSLKVRSWDWRAPGDAAAVSTYDELDIAPDGKLLK